ncbi:MAG: hypothetical protein ACI9XO_000274 [Paraglaciecola sp.]|jgi:hypothetical protein
MNFYKTFSLLIFLTFIINACSDDWKQAIVEEQLPWIHLHEIDGYDSDVFIDYSVFGIPIIYVLDENK